MKSAWTILAIPVLAAGCLSPGAKRSTELPPVTMGDDSPLSADNCPDFLGADLKRQLVAVHEVVVPLPEVTPHDADPDARRYYMQYYEAGYRMGLTDYSLTCCLVECPHRQARVSGWYDGQLQGKLARKPTLPAP